MLKSIPLRNQLDAGDNAVSVLYRVAEGFKHRPEGQEYAAVLVLGGSVDGHLSGDAVLGYLNGIGSHNYLNGDAVLGDGSRLSSIVPLHVLVAYDAHGVSHVTDAQVGTSILYEGSGGTGHRYAAYQVAGRVDHEDDVLTAYGSGTEVSPRQSR